ncbi:hypothetical protein DL98DRAFT_10431 [Cadophora sp. DSE1049]|nr:hypothetical protein DL98DRAFT_10431 [Cadophora sp. DSE1049]
MESFTNYGSYSFDQSELYDNTTTPYTRTETPDTSTWWKCCKCDGGREVNPEKDQTTCPDCSHTRCNDCKTTSPPLTPIKNQFGFGFEAPGNCLSLHQEGPADYHEHSHYEDSHHVQYPPVGDLPGPGYEYGRRPSMNGWWQCCQCSQEVNSAWYQRDCTSCSHHNNDCCDNLGTTAIP